MKSPGKVPWKLSFGRLSGAAYSNFQLARPLPDSGRRHSASFSEGSTHRVFVGSRTDYISSVLTVTQAQLLKSFHCWMYGNARASLNLWERPASWKMEEQELKESGGAAHRTLKPRATALMDSKHTSRARTPGSACPANCWVFIIIIII